MISVSSYNHSSTMSPPYEPDVTVESGITTTLDSSYHERNIGVVSVLPRIGLSQQRATLKSNSSRQTKTRKRRMIPPPFAFCGECNTDSSDRDNGSRSLPQNLELE